MNQAEPVITVTRGLLLRWAAWFSIVNAALFGLIGLRYALAFGLPDAGIAIVYMVLAFVAQFAVLGFIPTMLLLGPVAVLLPRKGLVLSLGVLLAAAGISLLVLDTNIFAEYRYHISRLTIEIFETSTWVLVGVVFVAALGFQSMLAGTVWGYVGRKRARRGGWLALVLILTWLGGQGIHIWADATAYAPVTSFTRFMPLYFPMKAKRRLAKLGWVDPEEVEKQRLLRQASTPDQGHLRYPLNPLVCDAAPEEIPNILVVLIDALRPDKVAPEHTPRLHRFAQNGLSFTNHYSGGNSSRMGVFSIFYGIPSTYWQAFYDMQRQPVLTELMLERGYEVAAFSSVGFGSPSQIDRTLFAAIGPESKWAAPGEVDKNIEATRAWMSWYAGRPDADQPFFSFLYYDPGNFSADISAAVEAEGELAERYESYMQGIAAVDREVETVLNALEAQPQQRETLVIVTSDHGYEFDELGLGNIGHASNYGPYQLQSVLLMDWPGREPAVYNHRSAAQDLPATLLTHAFGCSNPASDYSSGNDLFAAQSWDWLMAGSYSSHAIVEPNKIVVTYPGGLIELLDADYRPDPGLELDAARMQEAMLEMRRFYR